TKGQGELSPRTILHCHRVLSAALRQAVRWRVLPYNPAADIKPPKIERRKVLTYSPTQTADLLQALRGCPSPASASTISDTRTQATCSPLAFTPKLPRNGLVTAASASRLTSIVT